MIYIYELDEYVHLCDAAFEWSLQYCDYSFIVRDIPGVREGALRDFLGTVGPLS